MCARPPEEEKRALSFPRDCCSQGPTESPPHLGPKKQSLASEAASSSDGLVRERQQPRQQPPGPSS